MLYQGENCKVNEIIALTIFQDNIIENVGKIERCGIGQGNYVYIISCDKNKYVLRCSEEENAYEKTVYWLAKLYEIDIPVPRVLANGKYDIYEYLILTYISGSDIGLVYSALSIADKRDIAREVVLIQNKVANIELKNLPDEWTWNLFIKYMIERAKARIEKNGFFDTHKAESLIDYAEMLGDYFDSVNPTAYLDDISTKNLLVDHGKLSGIIDVDWIGIGDKITFVALTNVALLNMGYDTDYISFLIEEMNFNEMEEKAFIFYSLMYCVDFMGERGMQFRDKTIEVNNDIIIRLNEIYDRLLLKWREINNVQ